MRKSWDEYFMEIAEIVKTRSTCLRRQVGAVIVKDNRIITTGYNGAPSGLRHCTDIGCEYGGGDDLYYFAALCHLCENVG